MEGSGDSPGHKAQGQKVQAIVSPEAADLAQQEESARWDNNSNDNDDNESWRAEFDAAALKSSSHKRWKEERRIRQQEKQSISNYLRSIDRDARFVADFCNQPKCVDCIVCAASHQLPCLLTASTCQPPLLVLALFLGFKIFLSLRTFGTACGTHRPRHSQAVLATFAAKMGIHAAGTLSSGD